MPLCNLEISTLDELSYSVILKTVLPRTSTTDIADFSNPDIEIKLVLGFGKIEIFELK